MPSRGCRMKTMRSFIECRDCDFEKIDCREYRIRLNEFLAFGETPEDTITNKKELRELGIDPDEEE